MVNFYSSFSRFALFFILNFQLEKAFQYYESYSRLLYDTTRRAKKLSQKDALLLRVNKLINGFYVNLPLYDKIEIKVPYEKIVFGFGNGWTGDGSKWLKVDVDAVTRVIERICKEKKNLGGVMFWTIEEEGRDDIFLAKSFKKIIQSTHEESTEL